MATDIAIASLNTLPTSAIAGGDIVPIVDVNDLTDPGGTTKGVIVSSLRQNTNLHNSVFNVLDFGATGNGTTNDTAAIQAAITAAVTTGGVILLPIGLYLVTSTLVLSGGITLQGAGCGANSTATSRILWPNTTGFCIQMGNSGTGLVQGVHVKDLSIYASAGGHGITLYGIAQSSVRHVDIEGNPATPTTIGVQIDGASISAFFNKLDSVKCNHVFKGFVHTTTGSVFPTQQTLINCSAFCDNTPLSMGVDVQTVGGTTCGDGVLYVNGNMEECATGVHLNGGGVTLMGVRFENTQGVASDVTFDTLARNCSVIGCMNVFTLTDNAGSYTNQVIATTSDETNVVSQMNRLDALTLGESLFLKPAGTTTKFIIVNSDNTYTGQIFLQAGGGSAGFGGGIHLYGASHATHPGDVAVGLSSGGGKFRVNNFGTDAGTDRFTVDLSGNATVGAGFGCNGATPQAAATGMAALATYGAGTNGFDTAGHAQEIHDKLNTILAALRANGIGTT